MIIVYLQGGIGNQMFQYAAGRRLARSLGVPLKLDLSRFGKEPPGVTLRSYALAPFCIDAEPASALESAALYQPPAGRLSRLFNAMKPGRRLTHIREAGFRFHPAIPGLPDGVMLDGYFQSEKYFSDIASVIRGDFTLRSQPSGVNLELAEAIAGCNAVSIHIRRGDYVTDPRISAKHGACTGSYYVKAVEMVAQRVAEPHFFVFSDDPAWVRWHFAIPHAMTMVDHNGPERPHEDLRLMSACRHHIIANSSFSWWGGWLDPRPDKIVVAPAPWFKDCALDTRDLVPESWLRIGL